jgi:NADPH:quinone reductase-like Zn-dependent oxidoreductase
VLILRLGEHQGIFTALAPQGIHAVAGGTFRQMFETMLLGPRRSKKGGKKLVMVSAKTRQNDLVTLKEMAEAGKIVPVIDKTYSLSETAEALRYLGTKHARGKIVITMEQNN